MREIRLSCDPELKDVVISVVVRIDPNSGREGPRFDRVVERLVERGLRAQLQTQRLLTGQALVALDLFLGRSGYVREPNEVDLPAIPSVPSRMHQAATLLRDLSESLRTLPLRETIESANRTLLAVEGLSTSDDLDSLSRKLANLERLTGQLQRQTPPILDNV